DFIMLSVTTLYPGTELYARGLQENVVDGDCWREFAQNPRPDFVPPLWTASFSREELLKLRDRGYRRFYLSRSYVTRWLRRIRSPSEFWRILKAGRRLFRSGTGA
ncbi:MAG TPA: hypothetical protein VMY39_00090, partial [Planctomycetota bacterium]|nr:hypothetical protein [Planctomycetota bacterium]